MSYPGGPETTTVYLLTPAELLECLASPPPFTLGRDAEWVKTLVTWILNLYALEAWYPDVGPSGITLRLLADSVEARKELKNFQHRLPASFRAANPLVAVSELVRQVCEDLGNAVGWSLFEEGDLSLKPLPLSQLPDSYVSLLESLAQSRRGLRADINFFDIRQANLTLPQRTSRLAFGIVPPATPDALWQLRPQLQSVKDPNHFFDALVGWESPHEIPSDLKDPEVSPRLQLLKEFGRVLRIFPDLGGTLASSPPSPLLFTEKEMAQFLQGQAETLRAFGYPLQADPELAQPQTPQIALRIDPEQHQQGLDIGQILTFEWKLAIDQNEFSLEDFLAWSESPGPLFFSNGRWFWLDPKATLKALKFVQKQPRTGTLLQAMALAGGSQPLDLKFGGELSPLHQNRRFEERVEPEGFIGTLRNYQRRGFSWLLFMRRLGLGACLADDMGLGKTVQTLAALLALKNRGAPSKALLICPTSVLGNWETEAARFTPDLRVHLHHGEGRLLAEEFGRELENFDLVLSSYPLLTRDRKVFLPHHWDVVILDEAQQIKNSQTQSSKVARELKAGGKILLTGTPVENRLEDLWSLFRFLQPEILESRRTFTTRFSRPISRQGDAEAKEQLKQLVGPFILRRTKTDPLVAPELPDKIETLVTCTLTPEQAKLYEHEVERSLQHIQGMQGIKRSGEILRLLMRLKQLCDHPALLEEKPDWTPQRSGKIRRLSEIFQEIPAQEGILIFSQFSRMVKNLQMILSEQLDEEVLAFDGSTPRLSREQMVQRFQSGQGPRLFVISLKSGGVGLNLTRASTVVHFDRWWNPAVESQATDRAFRIGQTRSVQVFKFSTQATLEEQIDRMLREKSAIADGLIEDGDSWLTELNDTELARFLQPRSEDGFS